VAALFNMRRMTVTVGGTGTLTLGVAVSGWRAFSAAPAIPTGTILNYRINDGADWELQQGIYNAAAGTITRRYASPESTTGALLNVTTAATVTILALADDYDAPAFYPGGLTAPPTQSWLLRPGTNGMRVDGSVPSNFRVEQYFTGSANIDRASNSSSILLSTGSSAGTAEAQFNGTNLPVNIARGNTNRLKFRGRFAPNAVPPSSTTDYWAFIGFADNSGAKEPSNFAAFMYHHNGTGVEFASRRRSGGGAIQTSVLTYPGDNTDMTLEVVLTLGRVDFILNGVGAFATTDIPTGDLRELIQIKRTSGSSIAQLLYHWSAFSVEGLPQ
jgi:hypothetical protein